MKLVVEIKMGNDAVQSKVAVAALLKQVADKVRSGRDSGKVMDDNGNSVGEFEFKP